MRILVCGGAGFVGSHLTEQLLVDGHTVDVVDNLTTGSLANLSEARRSTGDFKFHHMDVEHPAFGDLVEVRRPEVIYQLTSLTPDSIQPIASLRSMASTLAILEAARRLDEPRVVLAVPAGLVYGEVPAKELPAKETRNKKPFGVPGVIAQALLDLLDVYRESSTITYSALAMSHVYGPRQRPEDGVVANFFDCVINSRDPIVFGNGKQTRDFLYIDDAVDALVRAISRGSGVLVNVGTGKLTSVEKLWSLVGGDSGQSIKKGAIRPTDLTRCSVSPVRAKIALGWEPWTNLSDGIERMRELNS